MRNRMDVFIRRQKISNCQKWIDRALIVETFFIVLIPDVAVIALIVGLFYWLYRLKIERKFKLRALPLDFPVALFAGISFASIFNSNELIFSFLTWIQTAGFYFLTYIFFGQNLRTIGQIKKVMLAMVLSGLVVIIYSGYQIFFGIDTAENFPWFDPKIQQTARNRIYATFANPNVLAGYLDICVCLCIGIIESASDWLKKAVFSTAVIFFLILLSLTFSRAAMITIAAIFIIYGARWNKKFLLLFLPIAAVILYLDPALNDRLLTSFDFDDEKSSLALRVSLWKSTLLMILDHPFLGIGWGAYQISYPSYDYFLAPFHSSEEILNSSNLYLNFAAEIGIAGLISFLWCMLESIIISFRMSWVEEKLIEFQLRTLNFFKDKAMRFFTAPDEESKPKVELQKKIDLVKHYKPRIIYPEIKNSSESKPEENLHDEEKSNDEPQKSAHVLSFAEKIHEKKIEDMHEGSFKERLEKNLQPENLFNWTEREIFEGLRLGLGLALISVLLNGFAYDLPFDFQSAVIIWIVMTFIVCISEVDE